MKDLLTDLKQRGLVYQTTPEVEKVFERSTTIYHGVDPTGESLHIGHLLGLTILKRLYDVGHNIIILVGGGTAMIGDPGGKDEERPILPKEVIETNKQKIQKQISRLFEFDNTRVRMVDNAEWLESVTLINFLRDAGKYIPVNSILDKEAVSTRLLREHGISYAEFSYSLLQAFDYLQLFTKYNCEVQIGGSDQWGNIVQGVELNRKKLGKTTHALSYPLIVNPKTGKKFGKTEKGASIWLDAEKTHPFHFYQFLINVEDELAVTLIKYFSFKPLEQIDTLIQEWEQVKETRSLQKELAFELTSLVHGQETAEMALKITTILFAKSTEQLTEKDFEFIKKALPYGTIHSKDDLSLENLLPEIGLTSSKGETRRLIEQSGIKYELFFDKYYLIRKGKKEYGIVEIV